MKKKYPGGMLMPGRKFGALGRYGFNGKEQDPETKGEGAQYDYGFRIYDPRLVRFLSVDPLTESYPWYSPYQYAGNSPIANIDLDGGEPKPSTTGTQEGQYEHTREIKFAGKSALVNEGDWYYHIGGAGTGVIKESKEVLTQAGWYNSQGYADVLASTSAAKQLSIDAGYGGVSGVQSVNGKESLSKFIGQGLNENAAKYLNAAAYKVGSNARFMRSGYVEPSSFNVEDILGLGILIKEGIKMIGNYAARGIAGNMEREFIFNPIKKPSLNSNELISNFGIYRIDIDGLPYKFGKADLTRVTKASQLPTRLHQQLRILKKEFPNSNVTGSVVDDLGEITTEQAKNAETKYLQEYYNQTGNVPVGNKDSFKPH